MIRTLFIFLTLSSLLVALPPAYCARLARETKIARLTNVPSLACEFNLGTWTLQTAVLEEETKERRFLLLYRTVGSSNETLVLTALDPLSYERESVTGYYFFEGAPLLLDYYASTTAENVRVKKKIRYLVYSNLIVPAYRKTEMQREYDVVEEEGRLEKALLFEFEEKERAKKVKRLLDEGTAAYKAGSVSDAIAKYEAALALDFNDYIAHNNLGFCYTKEGRYADAEKEFFFALAANRFAEDVYKNLIALYKAWGKPLKYEAVLSRYRMLARE